MERNYAVILGNLGNTRDRFCPGYKDNPDTMSMLKAAAAIPRVKAIEFVGTWDVTPANAKDMRKALDDAGKKCASIIPDVFGDRKYWKGSFASPDPKVRRATIDYCKQMAAAAATLGCPLLNLWTAQDGYDYQLATDYMQQRDWLRDGLRELAESYPKMRFALEYKPKEPRCFSYMARMADTLLLCAEVGTPNVGVTIDTGHSFAAGENCAEAIVLAKRMGGGYPDTAGRLFHMHFNDNHGSWDDDMIVGAVRSTTYLEILYWLDRCGYKSWLSMDQYPYREEAAEAIGTSIEMLVGWDAILQKRRADIDALLAKNEAVASVKFLRSCLFDR
jgi:xylose isomerase